jgi:hypothetical protein
VDRLYGESVGSHGTRVESFQGLGECYGTLAFRCSVVTIAPLYKETINRFKLGFGVDCLKFHGFN